MKLSGTTNAFQGCKLNPRCVPILEDLVIQHTTSEKPFTDVVFEKGNGPTILLHRPPGSGKFLTAGSCTKFVYSSPHGY